MSTGNKYKDEINPDSDEQDELADDDPEKYEPKYHFNTFEEWQLKVEDAYHELHKTVDDNLAARMVCNRAYIIS